MQVTKEGLERIKSANPLASVLAERGVALTKKGATLVARCPFHSPDKTPSFVVTPAKGLFHCFGCAAAGDVIGFVTKQDRVTFRGAVEVLCRRAGLALDDLMEKGVRSVQRTAVAALTPPPELRRAKEGGSASAPGAPPFDLLARVADHYHHTFCERKDARDYLEKRGLVDAGLLRVLKVGYADGSLLQLAPKGSDLRAQLVALGVITKEGRELMGGCVVVPIPDPVSGEWTTLYGRGLRVARHCYLPGPLRGVLNFQAARLSPEVVLTESVIDALSFHQAGIATAIPLYGTNGFTPDHLDLLKRENVERVILALDNDAPGRTATEAIKEKLTAAGLFVRVASFPAGVKDANDLLVSRNGDAGACFRQVLDAAEPRPLPPVSPRGPEPTPAPSEMPASLPPSTAEPGPAPAPSVGSADSALTLTRERLSYTARAYPVLLGRLRATIKATSGTAVHVDTIDLYASRSRSEFARRASKVLHVEESAVEADLLALLVEAEKATDEKPAEDKASPAAMSEAEREEALGFLRRRDLLDQVVRDAWALGFVGEEANIKLLFLLANSRRSSQPLSALILSPSGAGKSGITEVIEQLTPPEDVVLFTRLTPQSLYYTEPGFLDKKLVIIEERHGSQEADYSVRVLQSRGKLIAAAPVKDPQTGNMRTKVFTVEARAAFIEATTAFSVNHENATRCFELTMDESAEQTRKIHERQRLLKTRAGLALRREADAIARRHWNAQRLLDPLPVVIPFADQLTFPSAWMRTRRDHARFLNLIEVSAFVHQHQRAREDGAILASLADYETAYALAAEVLAETLSDVKKPLREAFERIQSLSAKGNGTVSRREIREALQVPDSTVRRWLSELVELEYLALAVCENGKAGQGKAVRYRPVEQPPAACEIAGLLSPEELAKRLKGR